MPKSKKSIANTFLPGYTLVEVMAAITLSTILILMIFRSGIFTNRVAMAWIERFKFRQNVSLINRRIASDLEKNGFEFRTDSVKFYYKQSDISVPLYEYKAGKFYRQGKLINPEKLQIDSLDVTIGLREFGRDTILFETLSQINAADTARIDSEILKCTLETIRIGFIVSDKNRSDTIRIYHLVRPKCFDISSRNYGLQYLGGKDSTING